MHGSGPRSFVLGQLSATTAGLNAHGAAGGLVISYSNQWEILLELSSSLSGHIAELHGELSLLALAVLVKMYMDETLFELAL